MVSPQRIAIIGAGPAGLTLARLLLTSKAKLEVTIYERDASPTSRSEQGGTLDLHADTGLAAIRKCGLWEPFRKHARYDGQEFIMNDKNATVYVHVGGGVEKKGQFDRPEIDRHLLREILLESVPEECIRWGRQLREVTEDGRLSFEGGDEADGPFDLIVGADGAWSKVRPRLTAVQPAYSGVSGFEMEIAQPEKTCPHVDKMVGKGSFGGLSDRKMLGAQRIGNGSCKVRSWFACPEGEAKTTLAKYGQKGTIDQIIKSFEGWAPEMIEIYRQSDPTTLRQYTLYDLPVGSKWDHKPGFTLIGDAASLMTPFSGEGVNKAMKDCLVLAEQIEESLEADREVTLDQAVLRYEQEMFPRARKIQAHTRSNMQIIFGSDNPMQVLTAMLKSMTSESSSIFVRMLGTPPFVAAASTYFWLIQQVGWAVRTYWRRT